MAGISAFAKATSLVTILVASACGSSSSSSGTGDGGAAEGGDAATPDAAPEAASEAGSEAAAEASTGLLPFTPSNISLSGIDLSKIVDEDVTTNCQIRTGASTAQDCFNNPGDAVMLQSDGTKVHVVVVKSLRVEPQAAITVASVQGNLPLAIVAIGDFTLLGTIDVATAGSVGAAGGFTAMNDMAGGGPGGGAGATGVSLTPGIGAGGGSYCGQGGQGAVEMGATGTPAARTAVYGSPSIVPLSGGSAGGGGAVGGGAGGGALQLVAGGTFSMGAGSHVGVGGGGGPQGGTIGQDAGGGGSGGSLLIEATKVKIAGKLGANGGGGGGSQNDGHDATTDANPAAGGPGASTGGTGAAGATVDGASATAATTSSSAGGGGGGAGRIRINSASGSADLTGATLSPAASTSCVSQGTTH